MLKSYNIRALSFQRPSRSSQCVTLVLSSWSRVQLYRRCDTKVIFTKKDVIPVSSTGMTKRGCWDDKKEWLGLTKRGCWNDKKGATWMARKEHWDDKRSDE